MMRRIDEIIIHCSATPRGKRYTVEDVRRWHLERGFADVGYHFLIYLDGSVHKGRPIELVGAHCRGHNAHSVGICYIGGLSADGRCSEDTRTPEQKRAIDRTVAALLKRFPGATVHGHNEFAAKACPCYKVNGGKATADVFS